MDAYRRVAYFTLARDASFVTLAAAMLLLAFSFEPVLALAIAANVKLLFAICLLVRVACLSDERIVRTEVWRNLEPRERPDGEAGRRQARAALQDFLLRFAKASSGVAILLYSFSLIFSLTKQSQPTQIVASLPLG